MCVARTDTLEVLNHSKRGWGLLFVNNMKDNHCTEYHNRTQLLAPFTIYCHAHLQAEMGGQLGICM